MGLFELGMLIGVVVLVAAVWLKFGQSNFRSREASVSAADRGLR